MFLARSISLFLIALTGLLAGGETSTNSSPVWISSTETDEWKTLTAIPQPDVGESPSPLKLTVAKTYQTMDGFGGCFNELAWQALQELSEDQREAVLHDLFAPDGANFSLGRMGMGANDFALEWYSFDETADDYALDNFSIERDRQHLIPFMKAAMKYQPTLGIWGVPWSPPSWMKTTGAYKGGALKQDSKTLSAYALYFSKFVQAYRAEGINLYAIHPQNEPTYNNNVYPQCQWNGQEINTFLRDYLLPQLKKDGVQVEVWLGTIVAGGYIDETLKDPVTGPQIAGVGVQYGGQDYLAPTHAAYPSLKLAQTETECFSGNNSWDDAMHTFGQLITDTHNFAGSYFFWNLVLNETGKSTWGWRQNCLVTVDRQAKKAHYNHEFYAMKHFSAFVPPGSKQVEVTGSPFKNTVGFLSPSGQQVVVFQNETAMNQTVTVEFSGNAYKLEVPAKSMNTVVF